MSEVEPSIIEKLKIAINEQVPHFEIQGSPEFRAKARWWVIEDITKAAIAALAIAPLNKEACKVAEKHIFDGSNIPFDEYEAFIHAYLTALKEQSCK